MARTVCRSIKLRVRDSEMPYTHEEITDANSVILTRLLPDGVRQPEAEANVLIKVNYIRMGLASNQTIIY